MTVHLLRWWGVNESDVCGMFADDASAVRAMDLVIASNRAGRFSVDDFSIEAVRFGELIDGWNVEKRNVA